MKALPTLLAGFLLPALLFAQDATPPAEPAPSPATESSEGNEPPPPKWPRSFDLGDFRYTINQPQIDAWDGQTLTAWAAVEVASVGNDQDPPVYGVMALSAKTAVDKAAREVSLSDLQATKIDFPTDPPQESTMVSALRGSLPTEVKVISLDNLELALSIENQRSKGVADELNNQPPRILFAEKPTMLLLISGEPIYQNVPGTTLKRVANTRALMLMDQENQYFLHFYDGWLTAPSYNGPWTIAQDPPADLEKAKDEAVETKSADLLGGQPNPKTNELPTLAKDPPPAIVVATKPTELIVSEGTPQWTNIGTIGLDYVSNTPAQWFRLEENGTQYLLISGRWFSNTDPAKEPKWTYVPGKSLPEPFREIPDDSEKENVKASIPGTPQAEEAFIANTIPQTERVELNAPIDPAPSYADGKPQLEKIEGTTLEYVVNSQTPVIRVEEQEWYAVSGGIWYVAESAEGPWKVATTVPAEIYAIPPSSPLYYVTYVRVQPGEDETAQVSVYPGYYGAIPTAAGTVVYGTGYNYGDYVNDNVYVAYPVTYGYLSNVYWTPWAGWYCGFGAGIAWASSWNYWRYCPPAPYWGGYYRYSYGRGYTARGGIRAWGPYGWAGANGHYWTHGRRAGVTSGVRGYNPWTGNAASARYRYSYNSRTGASTAVYRNHAENVFTGNYANSAVGSRVNPVRGTTAVGAKTTVGNQYTGRSATAATGTRTNVRTGNVTTAEGVKTNRGTGAGSVQRTNVYTGQTHGAEGVKTRQGGAVRTDSGNVYAGRDGNVYRQTDNGWNRMDRNGNFKRADRFDNRLNRDAGVRRDSFRRSEALGDARRAGFSGGLRGGGRRR